MKDIDFLNRIRQYALKFDKENGTYPEHYYEGQAFYEFLCEALGYDPTFEDGFWEKAIANHE